MTPEAGEQTNGADKREWRWCGWCESVAQSAEEESCPNCMRPGEHDWRFTTQELIAALAAIEAAKKES